MALKIIEAMLEGKEQLCVVDIILIPTWQMKSKK